MRIRTIKPEFFTHYDLFDLEYRTGLPLRVAYAGLWCASDREGRFAWDVKRLKLQILPFDPCDFGAVLLQLTLGGFIVPYEVEGKQYGSIPSWKSHQWPNVREGQSMIPAPPKDSANTVLEQFRNSANTIQEQCKNGTSTVGKGKGKGNGTSEYTPAIPSPATASPVSVAESIYDAYPRKRARLHALRAINAAIRRGEDPAELLEKTKAFAASQALTDPKFIPHPATWFNGQRYAEPITEAARPTDPGAQREGESFADWEKRILREVMR